MFAEAGFQSDRAEGVNGAAGRPGEGVLRGMVWHRGNLLTGVIRVHRVDAPESAYYILGQRRANAALQAPVTA